MSTPTNLQRQIDENKKEIERVNTEVNKKITDLGKDVGFMKIGNDRYKFDPKLNIILPKNVMVEYNAATSTTYNVNECSISFDKKYIALGSDSILTVINTETGAKTTYTLTSNRKVYFVLFFGYKLFVISTNGYIYQLYINESNNTLIAEFTATSAIPSFSYNSSMGKVSIQSLLTSDTQYIYFLNRQAQGNSTDGIYKYNVNSHDIMLSKALYTNSNNFYRVLYWLNIDNGVVMLSQYMSSSSSSASNGIIGCYYNTGTGADTFRTYMSSQDTITYKNHGLRGPFLAVDKDKKIYTYALTDKNSSGYGTLNFVTYDLVTGSGNMKKLSETFFWSSWSSDKSSRYMLIGDMDNIYTFDFLYILNKSTGGVSGSSLSIKNVLTSDSWDITPEAGIHPTNSVISAVNKYFPNADVYMSITEWGLKFAGIMVDEVFGLFEKTS